MMAVLKHKLIDDVIYACKKNERNAIKQLGMHLEVIKHIVRQKVNDNHRCSAV